MASIASLTQRAYEDPLVTIRVAQVLSQMAEVASQIADGNRCDITSIMRRVRAEPDYASAWVFAALVLIKPEQKTIRELRDYSTAIARYQRVKSGTT